ncbi:MAG TPA: 2-C-methyl-D-erythritol 4-phosphate cytidylyltransferase [Acidimicrobiales bacterium]|nr:2-C-methyl-D-erythritol 4-phosphate cytidylyltransferase [Acidimicrobiales bacterium]
MWAVVVAGGSGSRFGRPKQFESLAGRPIVEWSVTAARKATDGVVLVLPESEVARAGSLGADVVVAGGETRSESVRKGLSHVPESVEVVVVHDAARPLASPALFAAVVAPLFEEDLDGVVCGLAIADTLKRLDSDGSTVTGTVDRSALVAVQTPQAFRASVLRRAHANAGDATDDAALVEAIGGTVRVVPGEPHNVKLTVPSDLALLEHLVGGGSW